jgi:hypothetical protein
MIQPCVQIIIQLAYVIFELAMKKNPKACQVTNTDMQLSPHDYVFQALMLVCVYNASAFIQQFFNTSIIIDIITRTIDLVALACNTVLVISGAILMFSGNMQCVGELSMPAIMLLTVWYCLLYNLGSMGRNMYLDIKNI